MTEDQIKHMVSRFLCWRLPENFNPDGGISFKADFNEHTAHPMKHQPVGTNLLDAVQAEAMVRHMAEELPATPADEFAWLVEAFGGQRDNYLAGFHVAYMGQGFSWMPTWTADHAKALRFSREIDAKAIADVMDAPSKCRAVEHGWMVKREQADVGRPVPKHGSGP